MFFEGNNPNIVCGRDMMYSGFHLNNNSTSDTPLPNSKAFMDRLSGFIKKKEELLFSNISLKSCTAAHGIYLHESLDDLSTENYTTVPPIEIFMDVPKQDQIIHFYKSIERGKVVTGVINSLVDSGFYMTLVGVDVGQARNIGELKINAFCPVREIPTSSSHDDPLAMFVMKDKVRAVVTKVMEDKITVSLNGHHLSNCLGDIKLGIITDEEVSLYYSRTQECQERSYEEVLRNSLEYENPSNTANLALMFGLCNLESRPSLMEGLNNIKYDRKEYAEYLRKSQSHRLAMINVKEALKCFKGNKTLEAMQLANKALDIDPDNVEALVIRGALYANSESFSKAVEDFENALKYDPNHANALKYLLQVLVTYAKNKINEDQISSARKLLDRAMELNDKCKDRDISRSIDDLIHDIRVRKNHIEKNRYMHDSRDRTDRSFGEKSIRSKRISSSSSHHNAALKYYSPVYVNEDEDVFGPELPPTLPKISKNKKRRRSSSSGSSQRHKSLKKQPEPSTKRRKTKHRNRKQETSSSSSSSSSPSLSSSSSSSTSSSEHSFREQHSHSKSNRAKAYSRSKCSPAKVVSASKILESDRGLKNTNEMDARRITKNMIDQNYVRGEISNDEKCGLVLDKNTQARKTIGTSPPVKHVDRESLTSAKGKPGETLEDMELFLQELKCKQKQKPGI